MEIMVASPSSLSEVSAENDENEFLSFPRSNYKASGDLMSAAMEDEVAAKLVTAGPAGVAAAAAIVSAKERKLHSFETNPTIRKRQKTRLVRKLKQTINEYTTRVGQQAIVLIATPGACDTNYKVFGAKPLEDVVKNLRCVIAEELESALARQAPPPVQDDPTLFELPPLLIDGIPTPVEKMTQAQLRAFIPFMLKYSTGRGKPGWGRESTRPPWWPSDLPWANVRMDVRNEDEKSKTSWTYALRQIVINCYKYHKREDLLPAYNEEDERANAVGKANANFSKSCATSILQTITNADGSVSIVQVNPEDSIITLSDGTTARIQCIASFESEHGNSTEAVAENEDQSEVMDLKSVTEDILNPEEHFFLNGEVGHVSGSITVPASMYQTLVSNIKDFQTNSDGIDYLTSFIQAPKVELNNTDDMDLNIDN